MHSDDTTKRGAGDEPRWRFFAAAFGAFLGLLLLKFGNPVVMEKFIVHPAGPLELVISAGWPPAWSFWLLLIIAVPGWMVMRWRRLQPLWLLALPFIWFIWQLLAATQTVDADLTFAALRQFLGCFLCFCLGAFALGRKDKLGWFWAGPTLAFCIVLGVGISQRFGGLEETRRFFFLYIYPQMNGAVQPDFLKRITSDRIFGTLFYPNTLAGVILLFLPVILALTLKADGLFTRGARRFLSTVIAGSALACLYWSGSKGGWLLLLILGVTSLLHSRLSLRLKLVLVSAALAIGLAGFLWRYSAFLNRGATSIVARFDYWRSAWETVRAHPLLGTGPGTFSVTYEQNKRPESEMSRLAHNDFAQQASDSGLPGFLAYAGFCAGLLIVGYCKGGVTGEPIRFATWLGLLGWTLQSFIEFNLYVPALAWPAFALGGWLFGCAGESRFDKAAAPD